MADRKARSARARPGSSPPRSGRSEADQSGIMTSEREKLSGRKKLQASIPTRLCTRLQFAPLSRRTTLEAHVSFRAIARAVKPQFYPAVLADQMHIYSHERVAVFIDGANLSLTAKTLGLDVDFKRLRALLAMRGELVRVYYYSVVIDDEYSSIQPLIDWLAFNGFTTRTKSVRAHLDETGRRKFKSSMSVDLTVDAMEMAPTVDHVILFTGDGDYTRLAKSLKSKGCRVTVVSSLKSVPPMVSDALRRAADQFIELEDIRPIISRQPEASPPRLPNATPRRPPVL